MKICSNCGHENHDDATTCAECSWVVPAVSPLQKTGRWLKKIAIAGVILMLLGHFAGARLFGGPIGSEDDPWTIRSSLYLLLGGGVAASLFWLGDYLRRNY